jgi:peptide/nickel transport system substrate-binding protein
MEEKVSQQLIDLRGSITRRQLLVGAGALAGGLALGSILEACGGTSPTSSGGSSNPKRGGNFRVGVTGGGSKDFIDGQNINAAPDTARMIATFETLLIFDENYKLTTDGLAESVTQDSPTQWTIRVRQGIEFNNGKTLSADDVIYSLQRILTPGLGLFGHSGLSKSVDPKNIEKVDDRTVRLHLIQPDSTIDAQLGQYYNGIVPVGYDKYPAPQVGTGPYKLETFTVGQQSTHVRNPNYWRSGQPYFDKVTVIDFPDSTAQVNALLSGQLDAITGIPFAQISTVKAHSGLAILESPTGSWLPICMAIDMPPFNDVRVRQAFRLMADRPALVAQALSGHGVIGNDLYSPFDADFASDLPQRHQDLAQAKSLLKAAGQDGLTFDFHTTNNDAGMVDQAVVFAQQAKGAGVTLNVKNDPNYYGDQYLKLALSVDDWNTRNYLPQVAIGSLATSPFNATHWPPKGSDFANLYLQAVAEVDKAKRREIIHAMQVEEYNNGGNIIAFFRNFVDAYSTKVSGLHASKGTLQLDWYGHGYRTIWFNS